VSQSVRIAQMAMDAPVRASLATLIGTR
jgi:hypothetical protein